MRRPLPNKSKDVRNPASLYAPPRKRQVSEGVTVGLPGGGTAFPGEGNYPGEIRGMKARTAAQA